MPTLPPVVRAFNRFWPPAYVFETPQGIMHMAGLPDLSGVAIPLALAVVVGLGFGFWAVRRSV